MHPATIQFSVTVGYVRPIWISRENNIIHIDLPDGSTDEPLHVYLGDVWGTRIGIANICPRAKF